MRRHSLLPALRVKLPHPLRAVKLSQRLELAKGLNVSPQNNKALLGAVYPLPATSPCSRWQATQVRPNCIRTQASNA